MIQPSLIARLALTAAGVATILTMTTAAGAKGTTPRACSEAYSTAQEDQRSGHLRDARDLLLRCAQPACGAMKSRCARGAEQLRSEIALVEPVVTDDAGQPVADVRVKMDEEPLAVSPRGRPIAVDPGVHELSVTARVGRWPGREVSITRTVTIAQGQRGALAIVLPVDEPAADPEPLARPADLQRTDMEPPPEWTTRSAERAEPQEPRRPAPARGGRSVFPYLLGGVGLLGVGGGALLTYWGKTDNDALAQCAPSCQPSSVAHIRQLYLAADLSFGAGAVALAVTTWLFATSRSGDAAAGAATKAAYLLDVQPVRSGAVAAVRGAF